MKPKFVAHSPNLTPTSTFHELNSWAHTCLTYKSGWLAGQLLLLLAVTMSSILQFVLAMAISLALVATTWLLKVCTMRVKCSIATHRRRKIATNTASWLRNRIQQYGFISIQEVEGLVTPSLVRSILPDTNNTEVVSAIVHKAPKLFAGLLLIDEHLCIHRILDLGADDDIFISFKAEGPIHTPKGLLQFSNFSPRSLQKDLYDILAYFPSRISSEGTPEFAPSPVMPYRSIEHISSGGFGSVFRAEVAGGHLHGYPSVGNLQVSEDVTLMMYTGYRGCCETYQDR